MPRRFCTGPLIFCVLLRRRLLGDCANSPENRLGQAQPASAMLAKLENLPTARGENRRGRNPVEEWKVLLRCGENLEKKERLEQWLKIQRIAF